MKMPKSKLDEMQEQNIKKAESVGLHIAIISLGAAMIIQMFMGTPPAQWTGEFIVFEILCVYMVFNYLKNGIWDKYLKPSMKVNAIASVITGIAIFFTVYGTLVVNGITGAEVVKELILLAIGSTVSIFVLMMILMKIAQKRREKLDKE